MKNLSKTSKTLFATLGIIGVTTATFAANHYNPAENDALSATTAKVSLTQAMSIASQKSQGAITSAKYESEKGGEYEVEISNGQTSQQVTINATTGAVKKVKAEKLEKDDMAEFSALRQAKVSLTQALQRAGQKVGGRAVGAEFSAEHGKAMYEVEVVKGNQVYDVMVDATTGNVVSSQVDKADHDNEQAEGNEGHEAHESANNLNHVTLAVNAMQSA
jgi:uncharacterized membrane protein YkoI